MKEFFEFVGYSVLAVVVIFGLFFLAIAAEMGLEHLVG